MDSVRARLSLAPRPPASPPLAPAPSRSPTTEGKILPASRSRTDNWRRSLQQISERNGSLEISIRRADDEEGADLVWRVRLLGVNDNEIAVEPPAAFGQSLELLNGTELVAAMSIGQNRWMFETRTLGVRVARDSRGCDRSQLLLAPPTRVERCSRRSFYRMSTAKLSLAPVECWPLLDPTSAAPAEAANRTRILDLLQERHGNGTGEPPAAEIDASSVLLPDVGPRFGARLANISGGGLGLVVDPSERSGIEQRPFIWLRLDLRPEVPAPVAVTGRIAHTHIDSAQNLYAGIAFEFAFHKAHRAFMAELMHAYLSLLQRRQHQDSAKRAA